MTVSTTKYEIEYVANGVATNFPYDFRILEESHLKIYLDGVEQSTGFNITSVDNPSGGNVIFNTAPESGVIVSFVRIVPATQEVNYQPYDAFPAETHERALDKAMMATQQAGTGNPRVMQKPVGKDYWDAKSKQIKNLADPTDPTDAATKGYFDDVAQQAASSASDAENAAASAAASAAMAGRSEGKVGSVDYLKLLGSINNPVDGEKINATGFYAATEVGGGNFVYDAARPWSDNNGGTVIATGAIAAWDGTQGDLATLLNFAGVDVGCWVLSEQEFTIENFGALPQVGVDNTIAMQKCMDSTGLLPIPYTLVPFEFTELQTTTKTSFVASNNRAFVKSVGSGTQFCINILHAESYFDPRIEVDCGATGRGGVLVSGANDSRVYVTAKNIDAQSGGSTNLAALAISDSNSVSYSCYAKDCLNSTQPNESLPRAVSIVGTSTGCKGTFVHGENVEGTGFLDYSSGVNTLDDLTLDNCGDNGIYASGSQTHVKNMVYNGSEEAVVGISNANVDVGNLTIRGNCASVLSAGSADTISVGHLHFEKQSKASNIARIRPSNVLTNEIRIGYISGSCELIRLFAIDTVNGNLARLVVGGADLEYLYNPANASSLSQWNDLRGITEYFQLKVINITVRSFDGSPIAATPEFYTETPAFAFASGSEKYSAYDNFNVYMPDGGTYRGRVCREFIYKRGGNYQTNVGPYAREVGYLGPYNTIGAIPTIGYWYKGEQYITAAGKMVFCTVSGAAGATWETITSA